MERETKTIETPVDKHKVVLLTWITGRERRELRKPFMDKIKVSMKGGEPQIESLDSIKAIEEVENKTIETIIVSVNGDKKDILKRVLDMKEKDYLFVVAEINKITSGVGFTKPE